MEFKDSKTNATSTLCTSRSYAIRALEGTNLALVIADGCCKVDSKSALDSESDCTYDPSDPSKSRPVQKFDSEKLLAKGW